ncbi:MAG TPA: hypothetical protein ENJ37_03255 [Deltaproteobacteria bacterium]|nr:hypothetical protein [Deltaproteobacteria bacterium]
MLKVSVDQGNDYLEYLRPFILQVLVDQKPDPVTDVGVSNHLREQFGLKIPERVVQILLKRIARRHLLKKDAGVYHITGTLPDPGIAIRKSEADRHIQAVVLGLMEFSKSTAKPISTEDEAVKAMCAFLEEFNITCLRAYLRGTAIPTVVGKHHRHIVLVSKYVLHLQRNNPERFESFLVVLQGHMLANALLCPDLQSAPKSYKGVTFYLDTPLLIRRFGLEGEPKLVAVKEIIRLLNNLGGTIATFSHSRDELEHVLRSVAKSIDSRDGRGAIVMEAKRKGTTKSDLLVLAGQIDGQLAEAGIEVKDTPEYIEKFQIDEKAFTEVLKDEVSYFNPRAKDYDINSVRSIYVLRKNSSPSIVEKCRAILVTSNSGFARAAYKYGKRHEESREVSPVITDFSLANMAWLKAPMDAPSLPTIEILAYSYAALQPSKELLDKFLSEVEKLEQQGKISKRDHQLLRSNTLAQEEMMSLTLGEETALTEETVTETLRRVSEEIKKEESEKLTAEQAAHRKTREELVSERQERMQIQEKLFLRCRRKAKILAVTITVLLIVLIVLGLIKGVGFTSKNPLLGWSLIMGLAAVTLLTLVNLLAGTTVKNLHQKIENRCLTWFLKREAKAIGFDLRDFQ